MRDSWITVDVYGDPDGPAIVLVPGVMADAAAWQQVAASLTGWPTVAVVNRRGRHPSGPLTDSYSLQTEVDDLGTVLASFTDVQTLFGWSFGGLIALHFATTHTVPQLIAYEPVMRPFGASALDRLSGADQKGDLDSVVTIALREVAGMPESAIQDLRGDSATWTILKSVGAPIFAETAAINTAPDPQVLGGSAGLASLIVGELDRNQKPYGTTFADVAARTPAAAVHELPGQGHLAHLEAPQLLAGLIDQLGTQEHDY